MTTKTYYCSKDARIAQSGSTNMGSGTSDGLPFGTYSGYKYRFLLDFNVTMTGWTAINSATLHYRTTGGGIHVARGSDPEIRWYRVTESWSEGSSSGLSTGNAVVYPGPSATSTNAVNDQVSASDSPTWSSISITAMMRDALAAGAVYGFRGMAGDGGSGESTSSARVGEIYSRESGYEAYLVVDYETNTPPTCTLTTSVVGGISGSQTPSISVVATDPQDDNITNVNLQISAVAGWATAEILNANATGSFASPTTQPFTIPTLTRGTTYYVRARATDDNGAVGAWSATFSFKVASVPVVTLTEPSAAGRLGRIAYDAGSNWASPRLYVGWDFSCPDGGTQQSYRVEIANDAAGAPGTYLHDSGTGGLASTRYQIINATLTEGAYYHVRITVTCSHGVATTVGYYRIRVRWGMVTHTFNMGSAPTSLGLETLDVLDETTGGSGRIVVEYATLSAAPPSAPATWQASIGSAGLNQHFWHRVWLLAWGVSPAVSPELRELEIGYSSVQIIPDKWVRGDVGNEQGDVAAFVYGTKSMRLAGKGSAHAATQLIAVVPNTFYVLSARIKSFNNSGAYVAISTSPTGGDLEATTPMLVTVDFEHTVATPDGVPGSRVYTKPWFSGSNTSVYVRLVMTGAVGTTAWFDAVKLEASRVVTPWSPGYIANATVLDSGGVQVDAFLGGIFRLRGSGGGVEDEVTLGPRGLVFGGVEVYGDGAGGLVVAGNIFTSNLKPVVRLYPGVGVGAGTQTSYTWTKPAGLSHIVVECQGGGGASGGTGATSSTQSAGGGGGGGGGYARRIYTAAQLPAASYTVRAGNGGNVGAAGAAGNNGGGSDFGLTGNVPVPAGMNGGGGSGGPAGVGAGGAGSSGGGTPGVATGGDVNVRGGGGGSGNTQVGGGRSVTAFGGSSALAGAATAGFAGSDGNIYGGGGSGQAKTSSAAADTGNLGAIGCVIITEFYL